MAQSTFSVRMDSELKKEFSRLCNEMGMSLSTAINVFARQTVLEKGIPFDITTDVLKKYKVKREFEEAINEARQQLLKQYPNGMSNDEINEIISKARRGEK